jgi:mannosyltransferase OCH1-like enzyme
MIPRIIHYCWFGGKALPNKVKQNIDSWKKQCPNYKIIQWNENNYNISANKYTMQA